MKPGSASASRPGMAAGADFEVELDDDEEDEDDDGWGISEDYVPGTEDLNDFDYKNKDLNKCGDYELKRHKLNMDKQYNKNILRPGDKGFEYDKRADFKRDASELVEDSWDEDNDNFNDNDDDYFDDDFA